MDFESGHGVGVAIELVGGAAGTFVVVPGVDVQMNWGGSHEETIIRPHESGVPYKIVSNVKDQNDISLSGVFDEGEQTHDSTTGLYAQFLGVGGTTGRPNTFGIRLTGPDSTGPGVDEFIGSGKLKSWDIQYPAGSGAKRYVAMFTVSGPYKLDGELIS